MASLIVWYMLVLSSENFFGLLYEVSTFLYFLDIFIIFFESEITATLLFLILTAISILYWISSLLLIFNIFLFFKRFEFLRAGIATKNSLYI